MTPFPVTPFPAVDPIPLPAPVWIFKLLHLVTFAFHVVALQLLVGGLIVALTWHFWNRARPNAAMAGAAASVVGPAPHRDGLRDQPGHPAAAVHAGALRTGALHGQRAGRRVLARHHRPAAARLLVPLRHRRSFGKTEGLGMDRRDRGARRGEDRLHLQQRDDPHAAPAGVARDVPVQSARHAAGRARGPYHHAPVALHDPRVAGGGRRRALAPRPRAAKRRGDRHVPAETRAAADRALRRGAGRDGILGRGRAARGRARGA